MGADLIKVIPCLPSRFANNAISLGGVSRLIRSASQTRPFEVAARASDRGDPRMVGWVGDAMTFVTALVSNQTDRPRE